MSASGGGLSVFISYARRDCAAFAEELLAGLEAAGFDPFLDRHDIAAGEDWEARLGNLLQKADTVVMVLSPAFVGSERCAWEIDRARALSKRLIPVVAIKVEEADTPEPLRRLNYIFFTEDRSFGASLRELAVALRTDVDWIREHTRLAELAGRWRDRDKSEALLLRGPELAAAQTWLAGWKPGAPEPTDLHRAFINDSDAVERRATSEEARRLAEIAAAQSDKEKLLRRVGRANRIWGAVAAVLLLAAGAAAVQTFRTSQTLAATRLEAEAAQAAAAEAQKLAEARNAELIALQERLLEATSGALAAAEAEPAPAPAPTPSQGRAQTAERPVVAAAREALKDQLRKARIDLGFDVDVFWCAGLDGAQDRARSLVSALEAERAAQLESKSGLTPALAMPLGRIRLRELRAEINARPGYGITRDEVRAEAREADQATALIGFFAARGAAGLAEQRSNQSTPYYLSVFVCQGARPG